MIHELTPSARFAAQGTMWMDILGSVSLQKRPRFLDLYRRLRKSPSSHSGYFPRVAATSASLDSVMGCDDEVMFCIAEIAALAAWKAKKEQNGGLSIPELCKRGATIEARLDACGGPRPKPESVSSSSSTRSVSSTPSPRQASHAPHPPPVWDPYGIAASTVPEVSNVDLPTTSTSPTSMLQNGTASQPTPSITLRQKSSHVFREAAYLYLHTVLSGCEPHVPEIVSSVHSLMKSIDDIPVELDRSLAFPITLGGCLSDSPEQREFFETRLALQGSAVGNGSQAKLLVETVWKRRDAGERAVCWRQTMQELRFDLLLV